VEIIVYWNPLLDKNLQFAIGVEFFKSGTSHQVWFWDTCCRKQNSKCAAGKVADDVQWVVTEMTGTVSSGVPRKSIDRNFETITVGVYARDYPEDNDYFKFDALKI
jgi:hypothetical protein